MPFDNPGDLVKGQRTIRAKAAREEALYFRQQATDWENTKTDTDIAGGVISRVERAIAMRRQATELDDYATRLETYDPKKDKTR